MKKLYIIAAALLVAVSSQAQVVISQVYGGGGNGGSTYTHDFVELFNRGSVAVTLTGYTLQYGSASGTFQTINMQTLPTITIQPGKYFLIQEAQGTGGTTPLPSPDLVPTTGDNNAILALSGTNGKIVLASNNTLVTAVSDANVVDFVGFGGANIFEGSAAAPVLTNSTAAVRASNGCQDTNDNAADFVATTPTPRNSATAANVCSTAGLKDNNIAGLAIYPNPLTGNILNITSNSDADKAVVIFDVLGKQVINTKATNGTVNVSALTAGVYIVKVTEEGKIATKKLVVR
jgi:hypothetical protein